MKKSNNISLLFLIIMVLSVPDAFACFGDKIGIGHLKGADHEVSAQLLAIYIKEKTGIDSIVNEFAGQDAAEKSLGKDETDIIIMTGTPGKLDTKKLANDNPDSSFYTLIEGDGQKIVLRVSKKRLADMKFFTLNKLFDRIGGIIKPAEFNDLAASVKAGKKFPKQVAREYLLKKDLI